MSVILKKIHHAECRAVIDISMQLKLELLNLLMSIFALFFITAKFNFVHSSQDWV